MADPYTKIGFIYFIQTASGPIKIGYATDPRSRFGQLQIGHHEELTLLGVLPGSRADEKHLHDKLQTSLVRGEWFSPTPDVLAFVAKLQSAPTIEKPKSTMLAIPIERETFDRAMAEANGNISVAAELLGVHRRTLQNKMRALDIPRGKPGRPRALLGTCGKGTKLY